MSIYVETKCDRSGDENGNGRGFVSTVISRVAWEFSSRPLRWRCGRRDSSRQNKKQKS